MKHPIIISAEGKIQYPDPFYRSRPGVYIGSFPIRIDLEILPADPSVKGWKVEKMVSVSGNDKSYFKKIKKLLGY